MQKERLNKKKKQNKVEHVSANAQVPKFFEDVVTQHGVVRHLEVKEDGN